MTGKKTPKKGLARRVVMDLVAPFAGLNHVQWSLRITDTLVHRPLSVIRGMSFIGVFCFSCLPLT